MRLVVEVDSIDRLPEGTLGIGTVVVGIAGVHALVAGAEASPAEESFAEGSGHLAEGLVSAVAPELTEGFVVAELERYSHYLREVRRDWLGVVLVRLVAPWVLVESWCWGFLGCW